MLTIEIPAQEFYNEKTGEFINTKPYKLVLEHSLISVSKWEETHKKPFLTQEQKTKAEWLDYIRCMTLTKDVDTIVYGLITVKTFKEVMDYVNDNRTATFFADRRSNPQPGKPEVLTSELIYYWMTKFGISFECQKWHLSRLLTLIRICGIKEGDSQKMSDSEILKQNAAINKARRASRRR